MKQTSRIKHSSRRHRLLAALSACGFAACLVSSQYAQAAPQATELQVEEGEVNPDAIVSSWVVKHIVGELMKKLVAYPFGKTNIPFSAKHFVQQPSHFVVVGSAHSTDLEPTKTLSTRDSHRILN